MSLKLPEMQKTHQWYLNMFLINFVEFSAESSRGITLATLYLYNKSLGGDVAFMGLLTSVFSVGRFLSSMIFGYMCDRYSFRTVYVLSATICIGGNILYLCADRHVAASKNLLAFSRFVVGFGAGNRSVCRANVASMTNVQQRLKYITILAVVVFVGYALTPGLGSLVVEVDRFVFGIHLNKFTAPGVVLIALNIATVFGMLVMFDESIDRTHAPMDSPSNAPEVRVSVLPQRLINIGLCVFVMLNFNARGILSIFETVNIPLFLQASGHDPNSQAAVVEASRFQLYLGLLGLLSYLSIHALRHQVRDVTWLHFGFAAMAIGNGLLAICPTSLSLFRLVTSEVFVWSIGCPITTAVVVAAFSKILDGKPQGTAMGLLGSAASLSRIVLPLLPALLQSFTPLFIINAVLCIISSGSLFYYNHLVQKYNHALITSNTPLLQSA